MIGLAQLRQAVAEPLPHPSPAELRAAADRIRDWTLQHLETLADQPIGLTGTPADLRQRLDAPPPEAGRPFDDILADFREHIEPYAFRVYHPRFVGFVPGAPSVPSVLGDWLTASANFFAGVWLEGSSAAQVETTVLDWFRQWLGMPPTTRGVLTSGGSEANLTALVVARDQRPPAERSRLVLYVSGERHRSIDRAARIIGLADQQIRPIAVDADFRLRGDALRAALAADRAGGRVPWAVAANGGATNTGTVDALPEIAAVCREESLWFHVDAAYGWAGVLAPEGKTELAGMEEADSVTLDPHKWLAQTFDVGAVLVRDGHLLPTTFANRSDYLQDTVLEIGEVNYADHGLALTRRFRALRVWISIHALGLDWYRRLADHTIRLAEYAQVVLESTGHFEILCPRRLSIVCFRFRGPGDLNDLNRRLVTALRETNRAFLSSTILNGQFALRMCFVNWRTTASDVDEMVDLLTALGRSLA